MAEDVRKRGQKDTAVPKSGRPGRSTATSPRPSPSVDKKKGPSPVNDVLAREALAPEKMTVTPTDNLSLAAPLSTAAAISPFISLLNASPWSVLKPLGTELIPATEPLPTPPLPTSPTPPPSPERVEEAIRPLEPRTLSPAADWTALLAISPWKNGGGNAAAALNTVPPFVEPAVGGDAAADAATIVKLEQIADAPEPIVIEFGRFAEASSRIESLMETEVPEPASVDLAFARAEIEEPAAELCDEGDASVDRSDDTTPVATAAEDSVDVVLLHIEAEGATEMEAPAEQPVVAMDEDQSVVPDGEVALAGTGEPPIAHVETVEIETPAAVETEVEVTEEIHAVPPCGDIRGVRQIPVEDCLFGIFSLVRTGFSGAMRAGRRSTPQLADSVTKVSALVGKEIRRATDRLGLSGKVGA
jgi:hypothetical protein